MDKKVKTTNITYQFDDVEDTIIETEPLSEPIDGDYEVKTGVELDGVAAMSPMEVLLTATVGALLGNLLYHAIRKD